MSESEYSEDSVMEGFKAIMDEATQEMMRKMGELFQKFKREGDLFVAEKIKELSKYKWNSDEEEQAKGTEEKKDDSMDFNFSGIETPSSSPNSSSFFSSTSEKAVETTETRTTPPSKSVPAVAPSSSKKPSDQTKPVDPPATSSSTVAPLKKGVPGSVVVQKLSVGYYPHDRSSMPMPVKQEPTHWKYKVAKPEPPFKPRKELVSPSVFTSERPRPPPPSSSSSTFQVHGRPPMKESPPKSRQRSPPTRVMRNPPPPPPRFSTVCAPRYNSSNYSNGSGGMVEDAWEADDGAAAKTTTPAEAEEDNGTVKYFDPTANLYEKSD